MLISRAPVRISFFGGGTDYPEYFLQHGGAVLATAIDKFSYVTASPFLSRLFDYSIRVSYRKVELVKNVDEIEHRVYRECLKFCGLEKDIELHNVADLPAFTGLGSSSAFTVSLLQALHSFKGEFIKPLELAYEAIYVERQLVNDKVGCQDQVLAAVGGFNLVEFRAEDDIIVNRLSISPQRLQEFEQHLFIVFTGIRRKAADVVEQQLQKVKSNTDTLKNMRYMVDEGWDILTSNKSLSEFGDLLHCAWLAKRSLDGGISNPEIDKIYHMGIEAGAWGGKLLGAGAGGFMLFFAPPELHKKLHITFANHQILTTKTNSPGSQIIFC
ncbi:GHMP kinase [Nostoc sp. FACHB-110]|uniref:GHMP family kinase ATP-binding protein n=1 Tax=Nostoc sp. FACHB-110 TaxID=2692834 RepID=UPI0016895BE5|nr:GHMP kinase [Nostoc sp. FACHB-110]MBD2436140.1 GHMP kinase [Nostoc sp. FACHB-110]